MQADIAKVQFNVLQVIDECQQRGAARLFLRVLTAVTSLCVSGAVTAEPIGLLDRNGSYVSVEPYAPNIVRITLSLEKERVLAPAGYGVVGVPDAKGWKHEVAVSGDVFTSPALSVEVKAQPLPGPPSQMERYFAPSLPPVALTVRKPGGETIVEMSGWELAPHDRR